MKFAINALLIFVGQVFIMSALDWKVGVGAAIMAIAVLPRH